MLYQNLPFIVISGLLCLLQTIVTADRPYQSSLRQVDAEHGNDSSGMTVRTLVNKRKSHEEESQRFIVLSEGPEIEANQDTAREALTKQALLSRLHKKRSNLPTSDLEKIRTMVVLNTETLLEALAMIDDALQSSGVEIPKAAQSTFDRIQNDVLSLADRLNNINSKEVPVIGPAVDDVNGKEKRDKNNTDSEDRFNWNKKNEIVDVPGAIPPPPPPDGPNEEVENTLVGLLDNSISTIDGVIEYLKVLDDNLPVPLAIPKVTLALTSSLQKVIRIIVKI